MNFFLLPHSFPFQYRKIDLHSEEPEDIKGNNSLSTYLYEIKEKIKEFDAEWDIYKEYTNPFEYIHTRPPNRKSVAQYKPLSRSYFKMVEILQHFQLLEPYRNRSIQTFHLAEGPGGFIEALVHLRRKSGCTVERQTGDQYYGMTLLNESNKTVPSWSKSQDFLKAHPNITIEYGRDGTGNLLSVENFVGCVEKVGGKMDLITADGGFDSSEDFNRQEANLYPLLVAQICFAVCLQKKGGCFVLKIFDCFMTSTVELLYLLSSFYEKVYLTKPRTSRFANSEKYVVCLNFHFDKNREGEYYSYLLNWMKHTCATGISSTVPRIFRFSIPRYFMLKWEEYNMILGQQQIETIFSTISLMDAPNKKSKIEHLIRFHLNKCIQWCHFHGEPIGPS
jgi:23S rRNA U2552 (ribose-2'-O)-methylase RlmE/FtsJ